MEISFGKVDGTWRCYNILQMPLLYNRRRTGYKAIIKNGKFVSVVGQDYKLLPNEEAMKIADSVAVEVGAKPFKVRRGRHWLDNRLHTRIYLTYVFPRGFDIDGRDKVNVGFSVRNGIDGGLAFSASGFTFRRVCSNGVFYGYKELTRIYRKHTKGFEVDKEAVVRQIKDVLDETRKLIKWYRQLVRMELNEEIAEAIAKSKVPRKLLPEYITIDKKTHELMWFDQTKSMWDLYNDVTAKIWHDVAMSVETKNRNFDLLHQIIRVR